MEQRDSFPERHGDEDRDESRESVPNGVFRYPELHGPAHSPRGTLLQPEITHFGRVSLTGFGRSSWGVFDTINHVLGREGRSSETP